MDIEEGGPSGGEATNGYQRRQFETRPNSSAHPKGGVCAAKIILEECFRLSRPPKYGACQDVRVR